MREGKKRGKHQVRISGKVTIMRREIRTFWQRGWGMYEKTKTGEEQKKG